MAVNNKPIFTGTPDVQWSTSYIATGNTTTDLTSGTNYLIFTANATNGGYVQKIRFKSTSSSAATVARVWINNGSATTSASNNVLFDEISLPIVTSSNTAAQANYEIPLNFALPASYRLYITIGTTTTGGWLATVVGGSYVAQS